MKAKISDIQEQALKIDLAWVKNFNKDGFFDDDGKYKACTETASWAEDGYAPVTVMIYQEIEDQSFRVIVAYISTYHDGWCGEWCQDKRCPAELYQKMQKLEKQLMDLYDPAWFGKQVVKKRKKIKKEQKERKYGTLHVWSEKSFRGKEN